MTHGVLQRLQWIHEFRNIRNNTFDLIGFTLLKSKLMIIRDNVSKNFYCGGNLKVSL